MLLRKNDGASVSFDARVLSELLCPCRRAHTHVFVCVEVFVIVWSRVCVCAPTPHLKLSFSVGCASSGENTCKVPRHLSFFSTILSVTTEMEYDGIIYDAAAC